MMRCLAVRSFPLVLAAVIAAGSSLAAPNSAPKIEHAKVTMGLRGQAIVFRAHVTDDAHAVKSVTLFYAVSRDAAPYKVPMRDSGPGLFTGSIPAEMTAGLDQILYYIEARNEVGSTTETHWFTVALKSAQATPPPAAETVTAPPAVPVPPAAAGAPRPSWKKPALIVGGVLVAGGAALALSGGGGGGSSGNSSNTMAGTYTGTATIGFQPPGSNVTYTTHAIAIVIDGSGKVSSDNLLEGRHLAGMLSGASFLLVAPVQEASLTGEIQFLGTVVNTRIAGSVQGSVSSNAVSGTYSGNFSAMK